MVRSCMYPGCLNLMKPKRFFPQGKIVTFHRFPVHNPERLKLWLLALHLDINTPEHSLTLKRVCSDHFFDDDFHNSEEGKRRFLKASAVPMTCLQQAEETVSDPDALSADDCGDIEEDDDDVYFADDFESTSGKQKNHRTCPVQRGQQSKLILTVTNQSTSTSPSPSIFGTYYALPPTWYYQMDDPAKIGLPMEGSSDVNISMEFAATLEGAKSQSTFSQLGSTSAAGVFMASEDSTGHPDTYQGRGAEKGNTLDHNRELKKSVLGHYEHKKEATESEENKDRDINAEDMAQCSEELVITKVEDCTNEMAVDQNEDYNGKMEVDGPADLETKKAKDVKAKTKESAALTIKDEPMDEEWKKAPQSPMRNIKDDEDFDQSPDVKIQAALPVGVNTSTASIGAPVGVPAKAPSIPAESVQPFNRLGVLCTACNKVMLKGQTAFQRSGSSKLYCSPACLCNSKTKTCHSCHKEIRDQHNTIIGPVDMLGTVKDFCSQKCFSALNFKCSVCQKTGVTRHEVNFMGSVHKLCSDSCFNQFRSSNKLNMSSCENCGGYCYGTDSQCPSLRMEDRVMKFCKQNCLTAFKQKSLKLVSCKMCHTLRPAADAVDSPNSEGIRELFCSTSCVTASKGQTSSSGIPVECNNCKLKLVPQYHIAMFDGSVENFCSFSCVLAYKESFSKTKPNNQVNRVTSSSNNTSTPKPAAPKPASTESSSSTKTSAPSDQGQTVTKIPCSQCLNSFFHKPELLEFKRKMYAFCDNDCIDEFRRINNAVARCEYCKLNKTVKIVRRINKFDRSFCNERCKSLFEHDLVKRWGKKHCRNCFYCGSTSKTVVTEVFDGKQEEFCGNDCLLKHRLLIRQEIKCSMCRQAKKMTETVNWLGEMKHFCSLRCLMFFCSLQGVTGAIIKATSKSVATQSATSVSSAVPQSAKEGTPVIASVVSLSNASNKQPGVHRNTDPKGSVPAPAKVIEQKRAAKAPVSSSQILKNKEITYKPISKNKATSCKPHTTDAETQIDETPKVIVLPVPVPVYVPVPMHLYSQYVPQSVGIPLPVPVPLFFPTTLDSAEHIVKTIQEIKEKIPDDPLEADLLMMAEMVAEDTEREKHTTSSDQTGNIMEDLDFEALSSNLSWEEDSVSSAQTWDQPPEPERPLPSSSATQIPISTAAEEPQMDLEADFPVESIELLREQTQKDTDSGKRRSRKRGNDGFPLKKKGHKCASALPHNLSKLQHEYGVNAWKDWVRWRNAQPNMEAPKFGTHTMTIKEDLLKCCTAELSYGLCKFISEVRRPSGENYSPDSIFYLCLGIQQYLFENNRMENIFSDVFYTKFCHEMSYILKGWKPTILPSGYIHSRVEEEYLWDCKQLGAFSPGVLLNTLLYFFTKFFNYKTVEQHRCLSFANVKRYSRGPANCKVSYLRFYPPKEDASMDGVPVKKRKKEDERQRMLKIRQNSDNPLRCPVKLYEFYLSKCSPGVRQQANQFYLSPERSCVPSSPTWFTTTSLSDEALDSMLTRILTVRELHLETEKTPNETDSDSDSDFRQF
ncbi:zinc finger MYM-type protein 4-like isoform X5 [Ctenopharyngodon idella]|uniref:zinc finger MYM-type protein 4-like isoform X5 n=1 Tax=Ctenopharyngodon idella TaxID=7959 RepID=UPI002230BCDF|nr:zinc finger MYM-type protein 4-like isoform X5 [Ctenopharyngodon idella]